MFEAHKEKKATAQEALLLQQAHNEYLAGMQRWNQDVAHLNYMLNIAKGQPTSGWEDLMLKKGEIGICKLADVSLIEERRGQGHFESGSQGVSFPIGSIGGRSIRYRVGATRGHYEPGQPAPTAIAQGSMFITTQRIIFAGTTRTSECLFAKLIGIQHFDGQISISVSNRQKPTTVSYDSSLNDPVSDFLSLGLSIFNGDQEATVQQLEAQLHELDAAKPVDPTVPPAPSN